MKKNIFYLLMTLFFSTVFFSCEKKDNPITGDALGGGLIESTTKLVSYFIGAGAPPAKIKVYQGETITKKVAVYKQFFSNDTSLTHDPSGKSLVASDIKLLKIIDIDNVETHIKDFSFTYSDLIDSLILNGEPLSSNDGDLSIGSFWSLTFKVITSDDRTLESLETITVGVSSRFAGTYKVKNQEYWRAGVFRPDVEWPATYAIQSVNATTYKVVDYAGPFGPPTFAGNEVLFTVDSDGNIDYVPGQVFNSQPMITCATDPDNMTHVHCDRSNKATADFVNGKDILIMSCGYLTGGSGPREWYVELEKIP